MHFLCLPRWQKHIINGSSMWYIHYWKAPRWTCSPPEVLSRVVLTWVCSQFSEGESFKQWHGDFQIRLEDENMSNVALCMCADRLLLSFRSFLQLCSDWHTTILYILCAICSSMPKDAINSTMIPYPTMQSAQLDCLAPDWWRTNH